MQIEVKSCGECPFLNGMSLDYCRLDESICEPLLPRDKVHKNCPLKRESVTVKVKEK